MGGTATAIWAAVKPARRGATSTLARLFSLAALTVGALVLTAVLHAAPNYPVLTGRIVDNAALLTPADRAAIESELAALEQTSTDQLAVVTVTSLDGYPIEDYGIGLARKWALGQAGKDNGVLLIVAPNERKVRIEVGRRLEPLLTDTMSKLIIENAILPRFRRGDFSGGIRDGVRDIKAVILGDAEEVRQRAKGGRTPENDPTVMIHLIVWLLIIALIIYINYRNAGTMQTPGGPSAARRSSRRRNNGGVIIIPGGSSDWGGGWSGGGSDSGGGGWSGGGGSFGGGGASGDW